MSISRYSNYWSPRYPVHIYDEKNRVQKSRATVPLRVEARIYNYSVWWGLSLHWRRDEGARYQLLGYQAEERGGSGGEEGGWTIEMEWTRMGQGTKFYNITLHVTVKKWVKKIFTSQHRITYVLYFKGTGTQNLIWLKVLIITPVEFFLTVLFIKQSLQFSFSYVWI